MTFYENNRKNTYKYDNMHENEIIYALICNKSHVLWCKYSMLSHPPT